jgi:uncharacterized RDD family membrane protein YckC
MTTNIETTERPDEELLRLEDATRISRLFASIIDIVLLMIIFMPIMWLTGGFDGVTTGETFSLGYSIVIGIVGYIIFLALNGQLLIKKGQTLGKKLQNIKVVTLSDERPELYPHLIKRYVVFFFIGYVPTIGTLLSFGNLLAIFSKQKKCGHDIFAQTRVVKC